MLADDSASIRIQSDRVGDRVDATVLVDTDEYINLVDLVLHFDPTVLQPLSVSTFGTRFTFEAVEDLEFGPGMLRVLRGEPHLSAPKGSDLPFCSVEFEVIDPGGNDTVTIVFTGAGQEGDSAVFKDDGVPTDILTTVDPMATWTDLSLSVAPDEQVVEADESIALEITVTNGGTTAVTAADISVILPTELMGLTWSCQGTGGGSCSASGQGSILESADLPPGAEVVYSISGHADGGTSGRFLIEAITATPASVVDPYTENNAATAEVVVNDVIFSDGFETGQTSEWSAVVGLASL